MRDAANTPYIDLLSDGPHVSLPISSLISLHTAAFNAVFSWLGRKPLRREGEWGMEDREGNLNPRMATRLVAYGPRSPLGKKYFFCRWAVLTFPCLEEDRVSHDIFNLHCQNLDPEQSRYISLSGKDGFIKRADVVKMSNAREANSALAHSRFLIVVVVVPLHRWML